MIKRCDQSADVYAIANIFLFEIFGFSSIIFTINSSLNLLMVKFYFSIIFTKFKMYCNLKQKLKKKCIK